MSQLILRDVSISFGSLTVLSGVNLTVSAGDRVGIVAPNGVGKSTLLKVLAGDLAPDQGTVTRSPSTTTVIRLAQEHDRAEGESVIDYLARRTGVAAAQARVDAATRQLEQMAPGADDEYSAAFDEWLALGAADLTERAAATAYELGLDLDRPARSGGQKARLALAAALLARPDILLLDEPTNDLDADGLDRLEAHVKRSRAGLVLISHDRAFLSATIDRVLELDEFSRTATEYGGGYDTYIAERDAARQSAIDAYADYETSRERLVENARKQREWAREGAARARNPRKQPDNDKFRKGFWIDGAEATAGRAATADRAIDRLDQQAPEVVREPWRLQFTISETRRSATEALTLRDAVVERGTFRLGPVNLDVRWGDRVRFVGPNGSGKTTLIEALLGRLPLTSGTQRTGPGVVIGEIDQTRRLFETDEPIVDVIRREVAMEPADARTLLAKFRLAGDAALRPADRLSPGERTRAGLALLQARGINCLVLDEPTNHLDIEAVEQLEQALESYTGTLLLVTHDRRMAEKVSVDAVVDIASIPRTMTGKVAANSDDGDK
ncbi:MAG TPA: ABC-F family ATP-binding cassette domain-containing protein [Micromonosporaceae bacterium]